MFADDPGNEVSPLSELTLDDANSLVGKTVVRVEAREHVLTLVFEGGEQLAVAGQQFSGCALGVTYTADTTE